MKKTWATKLLALFLSLVLLAAYLPAYVRAEEPEQGGESINMTAGDIKTAFVNAGTKCSSADPSIAWVDADGNLNAMRAGETKITVGKKETTVTVKPFEDGSPIVGNLRILARFNDQMKFYDGHVYLLFTSYQDDVEICVPDVYGLYEISDQYYRDIRADIANGSNHSGSDADKYFTFSDQKNSLTVNRGEIITIGMYRDFDLTVPQAALGSLQNSTLYKKISDAAKKSLAELFFKVLKGDDVDLNAVKDEIKAACGKENVKLEKLIDGVVNGGVCFNRELYNQKLEWDQYENVTYGMDITRNQLQRLQGALAGNKNNFSILKNSCATVALRAWNTAVGTTLEGAPNAYYLEAEGKGIFALMDAPKTVRDGIKSRLQGYCLNNAAGVAEEGMGFQDETGYVYVSSPAKVETTYTCVGALSIDTDRTFVPALVRAADGVLTYAEDGQPQDVSVSFQSSENEGKTTVEKVIFSVNETVAELSGSGALDGGIWFKTAAAESSYVVDGDGNVLPSVFEEGNISFYTENFPVTYKIVSEEEKTKNVLETKLVNGNMKSQVKVFRVPDGGEPVLLRARDEVFAGDKIRVEITLSNVQYEFSYLSDVKFNGVSYKDAVQYDRSVGGYTLELDMPNSYSVLTVETKDGTLKAKNEAVPGIQAIVGDKLKAEDYVEYTCDGVLWEIFLDVDKTLEVKDGVLNVNSAGAAALVMVTPQGSPLAGRIFGVQTIASRKDVAAITFDQETADSVKIIYDHDEDDGIPGNAVPYSGYMVPLGTVLSFQPKQEDETVISDLTCGNRSLRRGEKYVIDKDVLVKAERKKASVKGMPATLRLKEKGSSSKFSADVQYSGVLGKYSLVYDPSIRYEVSPNSDLVSVDENGKVTVVGDVPEEGAVVYVTAYAGSGNDKVKATCKVTVGNYDGSKKAGMLTIYARTITSEELVPHSSLVFTTYEDVDLDVCYYMWHQPTEKYKELVEDYRDHPEKYSFDPVLHNGGALDDQLSPRDDYFTDIKNESGEPAKVSLKAGESVSMSNYDFTEGNRFDTFLATLKESTLSRLSPAGQKLIEEMEKYIKGEEISSDAFDAILKTISFMYAYSAANGVNPIDTYTDGGLVLDREMRNQFVYDEYLAPNNYYQIEITRDELDILKNYLANPKNNYYSLFNMNCTSGVVEMWNQVTAGHKGLKVNANYTRVTNEPQTLYFELGLLRLKSGLDGQGGTDYRPKCVAYAEEPQSVKLSAAKKTLKTGKRFKLKAEISPANTGYVVFDTSNSEVAIVNENGIVTAVGRGSAVITATTANGLSASCTVTVKGVTVYQAVKNGAYRYTTKLDTLKKLVKAGWKYSKSFISAGESDEKVYEIYYKKLKKYVYTTSRKAALAAKKAGNKAVVAFYGSIKKLVPVYEASDGKNSIFTMSRSVVKKMMTLGWFYKGIAWYSEPKPE